MTGIITRKRKGSVVILTLACRQEWLVFVILSLSQDLQGSRNEFGMTCSDSEWQAL